MQQIKPERLCWTVAEAAAAVGISTSMAYKLVQADGLHGTAVYFGSRVLISKAKLEKYINEQGGTDAKQ